MRKSLIKMKKFLSVVAVILAVTLVSVGTVGCEGNDSETLASIPSSSEPGPIPEPEPEPEPEPFDITMTFLGDMILGCQLDKTASGNFNDYVNKNEPSYFLDKVRHIFEQDDFTLANLEIVLTDKPLSPIHKDGEPVFWFKAQTKNIEILSGSSIEGVLLNNNHTKDYGTEGYNDTVKTVTDAGIKYGDNSEVMYFEKNGFTIGVLCTGLWSSYNANIAVQRLEAVKEKSDYQVVFFHGGTEAIHKPEQMKVNAAHLFVDSGADLVVGGHPHVLQPREIYKGVEIVYSVGNLCYGASRSPENRTVIYQHKLTVNPDGLKLEKEESNMIPCYVYTGNRNNFQPAIIEDEAIKQKVLDFMDGKVSSPK